MRIGRDDNFLSIELVSPDDRYSVVRIDAVVASGGRRFSVTHDSLLMEASKEVMQEFANFEEVRRTETEIRLTEGGWLCLRRDSRGYIIVRFRIGSWKAAAVMEGEVLVDGEFANAFCHEFRTLLRAQSGEFQMR